ncbi:MAG: flavin reductase family protein [Candidatus Cohnella colombiensis]|uniref:Flavin reductase family protein n=1 Tax=Candidatus Cohnella colombiensis TaxID=3121368 RepID=A0AA95JBF5_9BACL|nr:MAG: flavin reductase family protein [Cohnella sp.]
MRSFAAKELSQKDNYKLLIGSILPRPIAFVTTLGQGGVVNAAPYSYFNIVTANPALISISVQRRNGQLKDTSRNALASGEFVVHISDESYIDQVNVTAANVGPEESEISLAGLTLTPSEQVKVPGVAEARIRMECVLERAIELGGTEDAPACDLLIGRVVHYHVDDALLDHGRIDAAMLKPVSRLAGDAYSRLGEQFTLVRPE